MKQTVRTVVRSVSLYLLRVKTSYSDNSVRLLEQGGVIVCANHVSLLDGIIVALASPRPLVFGVDTDFSRRSKFAVRGMKILSRLGFGSVVPIDAQSPYGIRTLYKALARGESVMVFPEGRISDTGQALPEQPGVDWLVSRTKAPVVRVHIEGAERSALFAKSGRVLWPEIKIHF